MQPTVSLYALCALSYCNEQWNDVFERIMVLLEGVLFPPPSAAPRKLADRFSWALQIIQKVSNEFDKQWASRARSSSFSGLLDELPGSSIQPGIPRASQPMQIDIEGLSLPGAPTHDLHLVTPPLFTEQDLVFVPVSVT